MEVEPNAEVNVDMEGSTEVDVKAEGRLGAAAAGFAATADSEVESGFTGETMVETKGVSLRPPLLFADSRSPPSG